MLGDSDGSKDSSLESNEFRNYGRGDGMFKEVNKPPTDLLRATIESAIE